MELWGSKILVLTGLFVGTAGCCILPLKIVRSTTLVADHRRKDRLQNIISFLSCFAAGVFLAACFLDLLPEVREKMTTAMSALGIDSMGFPFAEFMMTFGLFLVLAMEQIVLHCTREDSNSESETSRPEGAIASLEERERLARANSSPTTYGSFPARLSGAASEAAAVAQCECGAGGVLGGKNTSTDASKTQAATNTSYGNQSPSGEQSAPRSPLRSLILLAALTLHSVFEGLAVGLQSSVTGVVQIFGALILHKCIIAFSIGLNLAQSGLKLGAIIRSNIVFSLASPAGVAIGMAMDIAEASSELDLISSVLQGLAAGTFLYIVFFELLPREFNVGRNRILKLLFVIVGFSIAIFALFLDNILTNGA